MKNISLDEERKYIRNIGNFSQLGKKIPRKLILQNYINTMESGEHVFWSPAEVIILCEYAREQLRREQ